MRMALPSVKQVYLARGWLHGLSIWIAHTSDCSYWTILGANKLPCPAVQRKWHFHVSEKIKAAQIHALEAATCPCTGDVFFKYTSRDKTITTQL